MADFYQYSGPELEIFDQAQNWKSYLADMLSPFLHGRILEVGAGIGNITEAIYPRNDIGLIEEWVCLEPDAEQAAQTEIRIAEIFLDKHCSVQTGKLDDVLIEKSFDSILYIDVLEHIEDDADQVRQAAKRLRPGGHLIVMAPAWPFLFSPLDEKAGHFRRYTKSSMRALTPPETFFKSCRYLDSVGMLASLTNRLIMRQGTPTLSQIAFWDRGMIPISRILDRLVFYNLGKSVLTIWQKID